MNDPTPSSRFSEGQIVGMLREAEAGGCVHKICRREGTSRETFYRRYREYRALEVSDARRLKALEEENWRLKRIVADQALNLHLPRGRPCTIANAGG